MLEKRTKYDGNQKLYLEESYAYSSQDKIFVTYDREELGEKFIYEASVKGMV